MTLLVFYRQTAITISPGTLTNLPTIYNVTLPILPAQLVNTPTIFAPQPAGIIAPALHTNTPQFASLSISTSGTIAPATYVNQPFFVVPFTVVGSIVIQPSLLSNLPQINAPIFAATVTLFPDLLANQPEFPAPIVRNQREFIFPPLLTNRPIFLPVFPQVAGSETYFGIGHYLEALREEEEARRKSKASSGPSAPRPVDRRMELIDQLEQQLAGPARRRTGAPAVRAYVNTARKMDQIAELETQMRRGQLK